MKLHIGCGKKYIPGYVHVDAVEYPHVAFVSRADYMPMVKDGSADVIYACHILEHFDKFGALQALKEWTRVLVPGGVLRVAVPDFDALVEAYTMYGFQLEDIHGPLYGKQNSAYNVHYQAYTFKKLAELMQSAGFNDCHRYDWRLTEHSDTDDFSQSYLPHMDKENGLLVSLNMEATKQT
jgi:predicted SAM-dependent methyltransferase